METLRNSLDKELCIETLKEAKKYISEASRSALKEIIENQDAILLHADEERLDYIEKLKQYIKEIEEAESLEEIANIWNSNTDTYENGSEMYVK